LDAALNTPHQSQKVYTYGPLIHNEQVVRMLETKGIQPIVSSTGTKGAVKLPAKKRPIIVIRAHGAPPTVHAQLVRNGYNVIDATCPHVKHSQQKVQAYARKGYRIIIVGDKEHAEVFSLIGFAQTANPLSNPVVVSSKQEISHLFNSRTCLRATHRQGELKNGEPICLLAQSTFQPQAYQEIIEAVLRHSKAATEQRRIAVNKWRLRRHGASALTPSYGAVAPNVVVLDTICPAPTRRQREVIELSKKVDALVVVGNNKSANTSRLTTLARSLKVPTFQVADETELPITKLKQYRVVGITAGTSTPDWVIKGVIKRIQKI
jgi:4-hydroxy-3-methylbut-2-enyl diphosphate reductase